MARKIKKIKSNKLRDYELSDAERYEIIRRELAALQLTKIDSIVTAAKEQSARQADAQNTTRLRALVRDAFRDILKLEKVYN
ncbi:hypothetical protein [Vibrio parahaemolyticus]|uniref:hypothetical protein n=1 Tax=Vibrio parahaemolyticus TaxID=670 RepID=UPI001120CE5E|nr:hypothetical protein [Vibrio parahaemolyticus]EGR2895112.1 hypothetical protein [Vibrio parahaemolyticus]EGR2933763.1 hypothetical protein [Vibrio parahaemolyticus]EGR2958207.1 hypothetical protein [Vibrio parahaemolyticus]EGR2963203.1 hypothetical protein [Vibrio parahaemolyticus]EGR2968060.1 hypothetical protein [Vibrio parahaemolyticus]